MRAHARSKYAAANKAPHEICPPARPRRSICWSSQRPRSRDHAPAPSHFARPTCRDRQCDSHGARGSRPLAILNVARSLMPRWISSKNYSVPIEDRSDSAAGGRKALPPAGRQLQGCPVQASARQDCLHHPPQESAHPSHACATADPAAAEHYYNRERRLPSEADDRRLSAQMAASSHDPTFTSAEVDHDLPAGVDQLKTFSIVGASVSFCRNPPFRARKPAFG